MDTDSQQPDSPSLFKLQLLLSLIVIAALAIAIDFAGLSNLFGVETITDAITPFLAIVIGGYVGIVITDRLWWRVFSEN
ncbi:hypothetical protein [Halorientalis pallida]|uniref:Uncharacterized protein n=1 Tax=Halorientalis pallida TaxID=2479928 RepID=A0A498KZM9_9EURY|nr:hypothetical protein [Halorientalis pallida]RXK48010.1 hypothetical protein EAF64_15385 [Halorientalis pallida]